MNYNVAFDVPAKYLGSEVTNLITSLKAGDASKISVPVNAVITGNFKNPKVSTDITKSVTSLTQQLVKQQKDKYVDEAKTKGKDYLNGLINGNKTPTDTTKTRTPTTTEDKVKNGVNAVKDLFGKKKKS
jgi:hypothetical protein